MNKREHVKSETPVNVGVISDMGVAQLMHDHLEDIITGVDHIAGLASGARRAMRAQG